MIKLKRPKEVPAILAIEGTEKRISYCRSFSRSSQKYINGEKKFDFDPKIYGHKTVKDILIQTQNGKCCFCESDVTHISYGDIEHFRPKSAYQDDTGSKMVRPGYYWLAYEWSNLLFCCQICNQRHKRNLFPLEKPENRAKTHKDNIANEEPVFINPYEEDPSTHISFRQEIPYPLTDRGEKTIKSIGLDRLELNEKRLKTFELVKHVNIVANSTLPEATEAKELLNRMTNTDAQYSLMINTASNNSFNSF